MSVSAKTSWIANSKRLALEADALERKSTVRMDELKHEAVDLQRARNDSKQDTIKRVHGIRLALSDIQNRIKTNSWQSSNALKHQLETFESKLTAFKLLMRSQYDSLDQSCLTVENEINQLNSDMDSWDRALDDPEVSSVADPEAQKRIQQRGQQDLQRRAFIGAIDRKVSIFSSFLAVVSDVTLLLFALLCNHAPDCCTGTRRRMGPAGSRHIHPRLAYGVRQRGLL